MLLLDDKTAQQHTLSIRLAPDGFSFFVLSANNHKVVHFDHTPVDINQDALVIALNAMRAQELFSYAFAEVRVLIDTPEATLVPCDLFDEEQVETIYGLNNDVGPKDYVLYNHSAAFDVEVLFTVQKELYDFFNKSYPKIRFVHKLALMLDEAAKYPNKAQEQLFVSHSGHHVTIVGLRNNNLIYHNAFTLLVPDDLVYYFTLVIQELGFDQYESNAVLDGIVEEKANEVLAVKQYLAQLDFKPRNARFSYPAELMALPQHYHSSFFTLPFCE